MNSHLPPSFSNFVTLPTNRDLERKLEAVHDYIASGDWREVTGALQEILDHPQDFFVPVTRPGPGGKKTVLWVSLRAEANRLLGSLPATGKEVYEVQSGARAAALLQEAHKGNDVEGLAALAQRFFHTRAGAEAADLLGTFHLDRGRFLMAASCLGRLLDRPSTPPLTLFKAALAMERIGDRAAAGRAWKLLAARAPEGLVVAGRRIPLAELKKAIDQRPDTAPALHAADWLMFGGDASRTQTCLGRQPVLQSTWQKATVHEAASRAWIDMAGQRLVGQNLPVLPGAFPLAVAGKIIYRSSRGIHALDHASGAEAWFSYLDGGFDHAFHLDSSSDPADSRDIHPQLSGWVNLYLQNNNPQVLLENSTLGTLSSDGTRVFAVEDLAVPPFAFNPYYPNGMVWVRPGMGFVQQPPARELHHNQLVSINLETGKMDWTLGRKGDRQFPATFFLGPPLPLGGRLYVLVEKEQELRLVCLEPRDGKAVWTQPLVNFKRGIDQEIGRRLWAAHPAYAEGILICPSNYGALVAVDLLSHSLLWAHSYAQEPPGPQPQRVMANGRVIRVFNPMPFMPRLNSNWKHAAPVIADGKVLVAGPIANDLRCLNLRDGALLWKTGRQADDCYLAGAFGGKVVIVGKNSCRALNLADGKLLWTAPTGMPSGRGIPAGKHYFLPIRSTGYAQGPAIGVLDLDTGKLLARINSPRNEVPGNLLFYRGEFLSQNATTLTAFLQGK